MVGNKQNNDIICIYKSEIDIGYYKDNNSIYYLCSDNCQECLNDSYCLKCADNYRLVGNKKTNEIICLHENVTNIGYYQNDESIYYKCVDFCDICYNDTDCVKCITNYIYDKINNSCVEKIKNCDVYYLNDSCKQCKENYCFFEDKRNNCINKNIFLSDYYYTKNNGTSYYYCDGEGENHIKNCNKCDYNENNLIKLTCKECKSNFLFLDEEITKCYYKEELNNPKYFSVNKTHMRSCSKAINNCYECENEQKCITCNSNYYFLNGNITDCININNITNIDEYYLDEYNKTYYSCNNSEFNSVNNCKKCKDKDPCYLCNDEYTFINGNKTYCIKKNYLNNHYYQDPNDISNYESCTKIDPNCDTCSSYNICTFCFDNFGLYKNQGKCINLTENKYYKNNSDNFYYLCNNTIERCVQCLNDSICLNCDEEIYTLIENTCLKISDLGNKYYKDLNTLHYVPCNHGVNYCETCLSEKECIKCFHNYTKIDNINSSCYLIDELNQKYYPDPNDNSNYIKCSNLVKNCLKCNNTQCLLCENDYIFINDNYTSCILKSSINLSLYFTEDNITYFYCLDDKYKNNSKCINIFHNNEYTIFILQAQIIDNYLLLFILPESILKNIFFSLTLITNKKYY